MIEVKLNNDLKCFYDPKQFPIKITLNSGTNYFTKNAAKELKNKLEKILEHIQ